MTGPKYIVEVAIGVLYTSGAVFHWAYTRTHAAEFYGSFLEDAWLPPARWFLSRFIVPHGPAFSVFLTIFQVALALVILTQGPLTGPALLVGAAFSTLAALVSSPAATLGNLALAALQVSLTLPL
jgi:hypothetical protein